MNGKIETFLELNGELTHTVNGTSMLPILKEGRDTVTVRKKEDRLKKYDIALYRTKNIPYVLHRVVRVENDGYIMLGDNCTEKEKIPEGDVIGTVTEILRNGKKRAVCPLYAPLRYLLYPVRKVFSRLKYHVSSHR